MQGDVKKIMEDAEALQPTFFVAVPRVLERLMGGIKAKVAKQGWLTQILFRWGINQKLTAIHQGKPLAEVCRSVMLQATVDLLRSSPANDSADPANWI